MRCKIGSSAQSFICGTEASIICTTDTKDSMCCGPSRGARLRQRSWPPPADVLLVEQLETRRHPPRPGGPLSPWIVVRSEPLHQNSADALLLVSPPRAQAPLLTAAGCSDACTHHTPRPPAWVRTSGHLWLGSSSIVSLMFFLRWFAYLSSSLDRSSTFEATVSHKL